MKLRCLVPDRQIKLSNFKTLKVTIGDEFEVDDADGESLKNQPFYEEIKSNKAAKPTKKDEGDDE